MPSHNSLSDEVLVSILKTGDESAFTEIYNRYWKKLFVVAAHRIKNLEDAEEIVQDIFTALWKRRSMLNLTSDLSSYLAVSVKYRVIKTLDKYYNQQRYIDSLVFGDAVDNGTQEWLAFEELRDQLAKCVADLPEKCRLVFQLSREHGYSQKQIAQQLHLSEKTVEAHLAKAFKTLRSKLAHYMLTLL